MAPPSSTRFEQQPRSRKRGAVRVLGSGLLISTCFACGARSAAESDVSDEGSGVDQPTPTEPAVPTNVAADGGPTTQSPDDPTASPHPEPAPPLATPGLVPTPSSGPAAPMLDGAPTEPRPTGVAGCFDVASVPSCTESTYTPDPPELLLTAAELGPDFRFVALAEDMALAQSPGGLRLVVVEREMQVYDVTGWPSELTPKSASDNGEGVVIVGCDESSCSALQARLDDGAQTASLAPLPVPEQLVNLRGVSGRLGHFSHCLFGDGMWCKDESGAWLAPPGLPGEPVAQVRGDALLTESGRLFVHAMDEAAGDLVGSWSEPVPAASHIGLSTSGWGTVAYATDGVITYHSDSDSGWASCVQSPAMLAGAGPGNRIGIDGVVYTEDYYREPARCRTELTLRDLLDEREMVCGLSRNWILMTRESLWSARGALMCAIG